MPPTTSAGFRLFLKSNTNMKLQSDVAVTRILYEGVTTFASLADFDDDSIKALSKNCKETIPAIAEDVAAGVAAEAEVPGTVISTQSIVRLSLASKAVKYYISVGRTPTAAMLHYSNILSVFNKIEYDAYEKLQKEDPPKVPSVNDSDNDRKIIKWAPAFKDCMMSRTFGVKGPLAYVIRDDVAVTPEVDDPLMGNDYYGVSGSLQSELIERLEHGDSLYRSDNKTVYLAIATACRGTTVESTVKTFSRTQDGRGAYFALIDHRAGESKYRLILKKRQNLLSNIKWNGQSYSLEKHVSNHRQAVEDLRDCSNHITVSIPDPSQRVEFLIDSINCADPTLQAAIGLIRSNVNNMRTDFESAANALLIEVDPFNRNRRSRQRPGAQISAIDYSAGRGPRTGVDLRWHPPQEFKSLSKEEKSELMEWQKTDEGKSTLAKSKEEAKSAGSKRKAKDTSAATGKEVHNKRKKWLDKYVKKPLGLKHVMSVLAKEESDNAAFVATLNAVTPQPAIVPTPNTTMILPQPPANVQPPAQPTQIGSANASNPPTQSGNASTLAKTFPGSTTRMALNSILKPGPKK